MKMIVAIAAMFLVSCGAYGVEQAPGVPQAPPIEETQTVQCKNGSCSPSFASRPSQAPKARSSCASGSCGSSTKAAPRANTIIIRSQNGTLEARSTGSMQVSMKAREKRCGLLKRLRGKC